MFKKLIAVVLFVMTAVVCLANSSAVNAQQPATDAASVVKGDANAGELNSAHLDMLAVEQQNANERVFVIARLGRGETAHSLNLQRLKAARSYLVETRGINKDQVIFAEGEKIAGEGRLEFYLGGKLMLVSLAKRNQNVRLVCCVD